MRSGNRETNGCLATNGSTHVAVPRGADPVVWLQKAPTERLRARRIRHLLSTSALTSALSGAMLGFGVNLMAMGGLMTPANAGNCTGAAGGPYTIPGQGTPIRLATDCGGGVAGQVTVTGNVTGNNTLPLIGDPRTGEQQPWTIIVNPGVTVEDAVNAGTDAMNFRVRGATIDNAGTISAPTSGASAIDLQRGGTVINRGTGTITATGVGVFSAQNNFTLTNEAGGQIQRVSVSGSEVLIENAGRIDGGPDDAIRVSSSNNDIIRNSGTIEATNANKFAINYTSGAGSSVILENTGTITGGANQRAIEFNNFSGKAGNITNSGTITGGALGAISFANVDDRLELQPGSTITGEVAASGGTDTLAFGGTGNGTFDLGAIGAGQQYTDFDVFSIEEGTWSYSGTTAEDFSLTGGRVTGSGTFDGAVNATGSASIDSTTLNGQVTVDNGATLTLDGTNTVGGTITVADGTLSLLTSTAANGASIETTGSVINYGDGVDIAAPVTLNSNTTQLQVLTGTATQTGVISETGGARPIEKIGNGTLILAGNNTYTGATVITAGTLRPGSNERINNNSDLVINGGTLNVRGRRETVGNLSGTGGAIEVSVGTRLTVRQTVDGTYAGDFTGGLPIGSFSNVFIKQGAAALTLTGNNSLTGGADFVINTGTLRVDNGNAIGDDSRVRIDAGSTFELLANETVATIVAGSGGGTINLNGNTLTLSDSTGPSALGSIFGGTVIGSGGLTLNDTSAVNANPVGLLEFGLSGANSFTGPVQITSGKLVLRDGAALADTVDVTLAATNFAQLELFDSETIGSLTGGAGSTIELFGGSILTTNGNGLATTVASTISGNGGLTKEGAGLLALTGNNSYTGPTTVNSGFLTVDGSIASSAVTVSNGGTLGGTGTTGATTVQSGGMLRPGAFGNAIGVTNTGNLALNAGSTLVIDVTQTAADQVNVTGTVDVTDATLQVDDLAPALQDVSQTFVIVANDGADAVTGMFGTISDNLAFLTPQVAYDGGTGNDIVLSFTPGSFTSLTGLDENETSVATGLDDLDTSVGSPGETLRNRLLPLTDDQARTAFEDLAGEIHVSSVHTLQDASSNFGRQISGRFANLSQNGTGFGFGSAQQLLNNGTWQNNYFETDARPDGQGAVSSSERLDAAFSPYRANHQVEYWGAAYGYASGFDQDGNANGLDATGYGVALGGDRKISDQTRLGLAFGYGGSRSKTQDGLSELDVDSFSAALYGMRLLDGGLSFSGSMAYTFHTLDGTRRISGLGLTANSDYDAHQFAIQGEVSKRFALDGKTEFIPFAEAHFSHLRTEAFSETGAGGANLTSGGERYSNLDTVLGLRFEMELEDDAKFMVGGGYAHRFGDEAHQADYTFAGGGSFTTTSVTREESSAYVEAGFEKMLSNGASFFARGAATFSDDHQSYNVNVGLKIRF